MQRPGAALHHAVVVGHGPDGAEEAFDVQPEAHMLHIPAVQLRFLRDLQLVAAMDLRPTGQAGADVVCAVLVPFGQQVVLVPKGRARTDDCHIAHKDIPKLGQLVQTAGADDMTDLRDTVVFVTSGKTRHTVFFGIHTHGAELQNLELLAVFGKANLLVKMGRKEEAYVQYGAVFSYIKSSFEKNYPKEIDQLTIHFQADQLTYQNEQDRLFSYRFYLGGIIICTLALFLFLYFSWKKIFRLKESKRSQECMIQKAERAIKKKNMFLSNMSHEVRTPLNAIVGFSAVLSSDDDSFDEDSRKEFCEIIKVNSFQLLKLINDILDFSDFENDNITFNIRPYDAVKLCKEVVETVSASRKLEVELRFDTELSDLVMDTDDARLRQVLINLLVNATKFTKEGSIVLKLEMSDRNTAFFSVTDTGCGIPLEKQDLIFERFEKLNDFAQGSGLGLSICKLIVTYMKGRLWVDSNYTQGARFCLTHPLKFQSKMDDTAL